VFFQPGEIVRITVRSTRSMTGVWFGYAVNGMPSDPNATVGATQIVEVVNTAYAVYSKTGTTILAATDASTLWSGFTGGTRRLTPRSWPSPGRRWGW
jgi:hypothetical protein